MVSFIALFRGDSVATAEMVTLSADQTLVARFADQMLQGAEHLTSEVGDPVHGARIEGERRALELIREESDPLRGGGFVGEGRLSAGHTGSSGGNEGNGG